MDIRYQVSTGSGVVVKTPEVEIALQSYDQEKDPQKALGFSYADRAGLLMARDDSGKDVTMRHEIAGRDMAVREIQRADEAVEDHIRQQDKAQDFADPLIGQGVPFERIRRITGYLVGSIDRFNNAKRAEEADRVKHSVEPARMADQLANAVQQTGQQHNRSEQVHPKER